LALAIYFLVVVLLVAGILTLSYFLGQRHRELRTQEPYESGMPPTGTARLQFRASYYLIAMFFVVFDLEAAFIYCWAVAVRPLGWPGFIELSIFIAVLLAGLLYLWREGALDWRTSRQRQDALGRRAGGRP
jgi:NADH-quinone oxidoreductase subunit A